MLDANDAWAYDRRAPWNDPGPVCTCDFSPETTCDLCGASGEMHGGDCEGGEVCEDYDPERDKIGEVEIPGRPDVSQICVACADKGEIEWL